MKKSQYFMFGSFTVLIIILLAYGRYQRLIELNGVVFFDFEYYLNNYWKSAVVGCLVLFIIFYTIYNFKKNGLSAKSKNNHSEDNDGWKRKEIGKDTYSLTKRENGINVVKFYVSEKLEKFDLVKNREELEKAIEEFTIKSVAFVSGLKKELGINDKQTELLYYADLFMMFWKIYNSYSNYKNMPPDLFNSMAYLLYEAKHYEEGIGFAEIANQIEEKSMYIDTMGEGFNFLEEYNMAYSCFSKAIDIDQKNKCLSEDHLCNYIRASIKTGNFKSAENGIQLLKDNFEDNNEILEFEKQLKDSIIKSEEKRKENEKLFNFKKVNRKDHDTIDIDWLSNIKPIYIDTGNTHLQHDVLYSENIDSIFLNTIDQDTALDVVKTIIEINGGNKEFYKYTKNELDEITDYGGVEYICCYDCNSFRISCLKIISQFTFEVRIERIK